MNQEKCEISKIFHFFHISVICFCKLQMHGRLSALIQTAAKVTVVQTSASEKMSSLDNHSDMIH